jgi:hypothetical protein
LQTIDYFCSGAEFSARFSHMAISKPEWKLIRQMCDILRPLRDVSHLVSSQTSSTIQTVIPAFNALFDFLEQQEELELNHQIVRTAASLGLAVLRKYYAKTDANPHYFAAVCELYVFYSFV